MKKQRILISLFCLSHIMSLFADTPSSTTKKKPAPSKSHFAISSVYGYRDFKFSTPSNPSNFRGHSSLYVVGGNDIRINDSITGGLFIFKLNTDVVLNLPDLPMTDIAKIANISIHNKTIFGHLTKRVKPAIFINILGGYGQNSIGYDMSATAGGLVAPIGFANTRGDDWFASISAWHSRTWKKFLLTSALELMHSQVNQTNFNFYYTSGLPSTNLSQSNNSSSFILERSELAYSLTPNMQPFLTGGLIQVLQYSNNVPSQSILAAGTVPDVNVNKNGYQLSAGLTLKFTKFALRLENQYYQRGTIYHSDQFLASLKINMG